MDVVEPAVGHDQHHVARLAAFDDKVKDAFGVLEKKMDFSLQKEVRSLWAL